MVYGSEPEDGHPRVDKRIEDEATAQRQASPDYQRIMRNVLGLSPDEPLPEKICAAAELECSQAMIRESSGDQGEMKAARNQRNTFSFGLGEVCEL